MSICQYYSERGLCHFSCNFPFLCATKNICVVVQWIESRSMSGLKLLFFCWWWWTRSPLDNFLSQACYTEVGVESWWQKSCCTILLARTPAWTGSIAGVSQSIPLYFFLVSIECWWRARGQSSQLYNLKTVNENCLPVLPAGAHVIWF